MFSGLCSEIWAGISDLVSASYATHTVGKQCPDSRRDWISFFFFFLFVCFVGIPWWWHHSWLGGENCGLGGRRPWGELVKLLSLVTMETCNWLLSSKNDQKARVLGVQFKLPKKRASLQTMGNACCVHGCLASDFPCPNADSVLRLKWQVCGKETPCFVLSTKPWRP